MESGSASASITPEPVKPGTPRIADGARLGNYIVDREALSDRIFLKFVGHHAELGTPVFIKVVRPGLAVNRSKFEALVRRLEALGHPSILPVMDGGCEGSLCYLIEPMVDGFSFHEGLRVDHFMDEDKPKVLLDIAEGLSALHAEGVIHGDLKTDTVFVSASEVALVAGYGFDGLFDQAPPRLDQALRRFCAPEVLAGGAADERSDVYSYAAVCACLLMGRERWERSDGTLSGAPMKRNVRACLLRGMAKHAEDRPQSIAEFATELEAAFETDAPVENHAPGPPPSSTAVPVARAAAAPAARVAPQAPAAPAPPAEQARPRSRKKPLVIVGSAVALVSVAIAAVLLAPRGNTATGSAPEPVAAAPAAIAESALAPNAAPSTAPAPPTPAPTPSGPGFGNAWLNPVADWPGHFRVTVFVPGMVPWTHPAILVCDQGNKKTPDDLAALFAAAEKEGLLANVVRIVDRPGDPVSLANRYDAPPPHILFVDTNGLVQAQFVPPYNQADFLAKLKTFAPAQQ